MIQIRAHLARAWGKRTGGLTRVLQSNVVNNLVAFLITIYAARSMSQSVFAQVTVAISTITLLALVLDFGLGVTLVKLFSTSKDDHERRTLIGTVLKWKLGLLFVLPVATWAAEGVLIRLVPLFTYDRPLLYVTVFSAGLQSLWVSVRSVEQAREDFGAFGVQVNTLSVLRIITFCGLWVTSWRGSLLVVTSLYALPLVGLLMIWLIRHRTDWLHTWSFSTLRRAFGYGAWVGVSAAAFNALNRLPQFALASAGASSEVAVYGAALTFVGMYSLLNDAIRTVLLPRVAGLQTVQEWRQFRKRVWCKLPHFLVLMVTSMFTLVFLQQFALGMEYRASSVVFVLLAAAVGITMFLGISNSLIHAHGIPKVDAVVNLVRVCMLWLLVKNVQATAMSVTWVYACVIVIGELFLYLWLQSREG